MTQVVLPLRSSSRLQGSAKVLVRGRQVYELTEGQFIGEMGLHGVLVLCVGRLSPVLPVGLRISAALQSSASVEIKYSVQACQL